MGCRSTVTRSIVSGSMPPSFATSGLPSMATYRLRSPSTSPGSAAFRLPPRVLARFGRRYPKVTVRIVTDLGGGSRGIAGEVADGRAGVGAVSPPVYVDGLVTKKLYAEPYLPAYPRGHPDPQSPHPRSARRATGDEGRARPGPRRAVICPGGNGAGPGERRRAGGAVQGPCRPRRRSGRGRMVAGDGRSVSRRRWRRR
ncbi:LysR family transcriptional regulator substrate-binding protein [Nonomuraea candida]|uniref:LysR family transcriptional regulator substrate-binding protein n=1 Tax=Nonomuraea candida TaxID=359159 RepID=UPI000A000FE5